MLKRGYPESRLGVVANLLPDMSAEGLLRARVTGDTMLRKQKFSDRPLTDRLRDSGGQDHSVTGREGVHFELQKDLGTPGARIPKKGSEGKWWAPDPAFSERFGNHFAAIVWPEPEVIDPSSDARRPLSMADWRESQNHPEAISLVADLRGSFRIHTESMSDRQLARLAHILNTHASSRNAIDRRLHRLSRAEYRNLLLELFSFRAGPRDLEINKGSQLLFYESYSSAIENIVLSDSNLFTHDDGDIKSSMDNYLDQLSPLAKYHSWLRETDEPT